ncbi:hypothetical protein [Saccharothrix lopnurensis]|uniref:MFS transporter n=1 Tax=Saccharothrix lopnurensis TaxID=1670621 RepID=A0ABW1P831_9PSEU
MGLVVTVTRIGYALGVFLLVPLGDIVNRKRMIPALVLPAAAMPGTSAFAPTFPALLVTLALVGVSTTGVTFLLTANPFGFSATQIGLTSLIGIVGALATRSRLNTLFIVGDFIGGAIGSVLAPPGTRTHAASTSTSRSTGTPPHPGASMTLIDCPASTRPASGHETTGQTRGRCPHLDECGSR